MYGGKRVDLLLFSLRQPSIFVPEVDRETSRSNPKENQVTWENRIQSFENQNLKNRIQSFENQDLRNEHPNLEKPTSPMKTRF